MAAVSFKCPNCGGGLQFDPGSQRYKCEYCLSKFTQEQLEALEPEAASGPAVQPEAKAASEEASGQAFQTEEGFGAHAVVYTCPSCGAEIVTEETTAATFCFYCHNPVVLKGRLEGEYQPDYVVPFSIDRKKAEEIFFQWLDRKRFVPDGFSSPEQMEKLSGVYFPYWMYSCQVDGKLEGEGHILRTWTSGQTEYTETKKFDVLRTGTMAVNHVTRNALKKADKKLVEGVMPFRFSGLQPFSMGYLSGFMAEKRDMEQQEFTEDVEGEVQEFAVSQLRNSVTAYHSLEVRDQQVKLRDGRWEYVLLPVWTLTYKDRNTNHIYYFACNGQTGKICGKLPVDWKKLLLFFTKIFAPLCAVLLAAGYFL